MSVIYFDDWQTPAAIGVVAITVLIFVARFARKKKKGGGCGGGCDCPVNKPKK